MKTLILLPIIAAAMLLGTSAKAGEPEINCTSVNFALTLRCNKDNTRFDHHKSKTVVNTWKVTNKDILGIVQEIFGDELPFDFTGDDPTVGFVLCNEDPNHSNFCDGLFVLTFDGTPIFPVPEEIFSWKPDCECGIVTGSAKDGDSAESEVCTVGKWVTELPASFTFTNPENDDFPFASFCGSAKVKTEIKYDGDGKGGSKGGNGSECTSTESYVFSGTGCFDYFDCNWLITGQITGNGVNTSNFEYWNDFWGVEDWFEE